MWGTEPGSQKEPGSLNLGGMKLLSLVSDGERRLRQAVNTQVRREFELELAVASFWRRQIIQAKIRQETRARLKRLLSPYSLWGAL